MQALRSPLPYVSTAAVARLASLASKTNYAFFFEYGVARLRLPRREKKTLKAPAPRCFYIVVY